MGEALEGARLVTVLGPPGTGKTRLAKEYALSILGTPWERAADGPSSIEAGIFFCDLSDAIGADDLLARLATTLGLDRVGAPSDLVETIATALGAEWPALVILDNFEQLVSPREPGPSSVEVVAALWAANAHTRWLVTSRQRLGLAAETLFDLGPLTLPRDGSLESEAIELFVKRARAVSGAYAPGPEEIADIAALVTHLDGLPLAIELAAARTRVLHPREIIERLTDRFALLAKDSSTLGRGSATLWQTIDASWRLLSAEEQRALGLLSVFRGGFDVRAAEAVVASERGGPPTIDILQSLRDKSLVLVDEADPSQRRFTLLASIRAFASDRLDEAERAAGELRHARHYIESGKALGEKLATGGDPSAARRLAMEHENLLAVHRRFLDPARGGALKDAAIEAALVVCQSASAYPYSFCLGLLDSAIAAAESLEHKPSTLLLCRALEARGNLRRFVGRVEESIEDFERMRSVAEAAGERSLSAAALSGLGNGATVRASWKEARSYFERALAIHVAERDRRAEGRTLAMLAATLYNEDAPEEARPLLERALALTRASRDRLYEGICVTSLGIVTLAQGSLSEARTFLSDGLRIHRDGGVRHWEGVTLSYLAMVEQESGRMAEAHELYARAIDLLVEVDVRRAEGLARFARASAWLSQGRVGEAKAELQHALDRCRAMAPDHEGLVLGALGAVAAIESDLVAAVDLFACADLALGPWARASFKAAIDAYRGILDVTRARADEGRAKRGHLRAAQGRLEATAEASQRSFELRVARRELERAISDATARRDASSSDPKRALVVGPRGLWFRPPRTKESVHLHRRRALQHILHDLALHREQAPGEALAIPRLVAAGWPGERVLAEAGTERVYTAVATLRRLGLKGVLLQRDDGYLLDASVPLLRSPSST